MLEDAFNRISFDAPSLNFNFCRKIINLFEMNRNLLLTGSKTRKKASIEKHMHCGVFGKAAKVAKVAKLILSPNMYNYE